MKTDEMIETDVLIIGGGIAGLYAGVEAVSRGQRVVILIKGPTCSVSIGGCSVAFRKSPFGDSPAQFFDDLIMGGKHLNDRSLIAILAYESEAVLNELVQMGIQFQKRNDELALRKTAGNSLPRTVYYGLSTIGLNMTKGFLKCLDLKGAKLLRNTTAISLVKDHSRVLGASAISSQGELLFVHSKATILATGGAGSLYSFCTTPRSIDGDGYRMAFEAGADLMDMEFVQFEPFVFVTPPRLKGRTVFTSSIWEGAKLQNAHQEEFLPKDSKGVVLDLTKDVLSRLIYSQVSSGRGTRNGGVYLDWRGLPSKSLWNYPRFVKKCQSKGVDPYKVPLEVAPAAHHMMGGVTIDSYCRSTVKGLFAAGEVTSGIHGANRLAGAACIDGLVFGKRAGKYAAMYAKQNELLPKNVFKEIVHEHLRRLNNLINVDDGREKDFNKIIHRVKLIMWNKVGIIRNEKDLQEAVGELSRLNTLVNQAKISKPKYRGLYFKTKSACFVSLCIAKAALIRQESRGDHTREDYLERDDLNWLKHIVFSSSNKGELQIRLRGTEAENPPSWFDQELSE